MLEELDGEFEGRLVTKFSDLQRSILKQFADQRLATMTGIAKNLNRKASDISSSVRRLVDAMILAKNNEGLYFITDEVFRRWIGRELG